jgi:hypothetical protein
MQKDNANSMFLNCENHCFLKTGKPKTEHSRQQNIVENEKKEINYRTACFSTTFSDC